MYPPPLRLPLLLALLLAAPAQAARPMITDDARVVDAQSCQLESWVRQNRDDREVWALPACNFSGNLELTLGGGKTGLDSGVAHDHHLVLQGKTLLKPLTTNSYGVGLALGYAQHRLRSDHRYVAGDSYVYVPVSISTLDDRVVWHVNGGALHSQEARRNFATWGLASEIQLQANTWLVAETFGQSGGTRYAQAGLRHWIVPNRVQVDMTVGERLHGGPSERWFSIGLRLLSPAFLP